MKVILVLPNQLFENNALIEKGAIVYIYEHPVYFCMYKYHKMKLVLHRASMQQYKDFLEKKYQCKVRYIEFNQKLDIAANQIVNMYDPIDYHAIDYLKKSNIKLKLYDSPLFLTTKKDLQDYLDQGGTFHQTTFYIWQRRRLNILLDSNGKPLGGKWTYDTKNRKPFPKDFPNEKSPKLLKNKYVLEAKEYVDKHFRENIGSQDIYLPIDHVGAKKHLNKFIKEKLDCFGPYEDAVSDKVIFGCHSVLSPLMNIGLLTHEYVIESILKYYYKNTKTVRLESVEAIVRQIIGWANIMHLMYVYNHKQMIEGNYFSNERKLPKSWYNATTGIAPIDDLINKVLKYGYAHHIERLMYLSNFMLLNEFEPKSVHDWFMQMFIDSYHVFMEPNVYAMGQYSTGPLLMTRPYFSSSNYIDKMSTYKRSKNKYQVINLDDQSYEWYEVWDILYYNFINKHKTVLSKNYSTASAVTHWNNKKEIQKRQILALAKEYFKKY